MNGPLLWSAPINLHAGAEATATHVLTANTHIILPQNCSQLKAITALKLGAAVFVQPTSVWQRERWMPAVTTFPSALLTSVTGAGLRLLPAAGGRRAEELQHLLSGLGCSTQEWLLIKRSRGRTPSNQRLKLWQSKWRKKLSFVLFYHGAFFLQIIWARSSSASGFKWDLFDGCCRQNPVTESNPFSGTQVTLFKTGWCWPRGARKEHKHTTLRYQLHTFTCRSSSFTFVNERFSSHQQRSSPSVDQNSVLLFWATVLVVKYIKLYCTVILVAVTCQYLDVSCWEPCGTCTGSKVGFLETENWV